MPELTLIPRAELRELQDQSIYLFDDTVRDDSTIDEIVDFFKTEVGVTQLEVRAVTMLKEL